MTDQPGPTLSRVPIAPCPICGRSCWHQAPYAEAAKRGIWYCCACGAEYAPPAPMRVPRDPRIRQRPASEEWR